MRFLLHWIKWIKLVIETISNKWSKTSKRCLDPFCPYIVLNNMSDDLLIELKLASSKREAREFIRNGAVMINGEKASDEFMIINKDIAIEGRFIVIRRGKKLYAVVEF